ncbi:glyoxalase-like domain protein [Paraburkholderia fungorum]|jgi:catechol 2,3-dioxygenase-like lactoylglutathione lyase family enzyme|uniref:Glyoxalase-like domain protein n=1 Tax=Paraburkholderia fungorum TaxID=134537 RepID=A0AAP5QJM6_9BURK|nr:VOC family protein [Paraburkholderia fungorum]AJZ57104.1 glyoxalase-like domain protein [Paraburkholderia fungorum]MDT8843497.1 VOC family protein [Paraburkholderia fungorum]PRZ45499.1 catechol 2,3-dioxygenase-like lactoylglutathione lyase family enzyme [Paraburkholderia fungorum]
MIDHLSLGVSELARSRRFYDTALGVLGYLLLSADDSSLSYGAGNPTLWLLRTSRPVAADAESGLHLSFAATTPAQVDAFYRAALDNGGSDNGRPGLRETYSAGYYAAFVLDPDGYRLEAHCELTGMPK